MPSCACTTGSPGRPCPLPVCDSLRVALVTKRYGLAPSIAWMAPSSYKSHTIYVRLSFAALAHRDLLDGIRGTITVVMTVGALQDFKRHSEIPSCLSWLRFPQPSAKSPLCVAGILRTKPASLTALLNAVFDWRNRLAVELKEVFRDQCGADAASGRAIVKGLGLPLAACWSSRAEARLPCRRGIALAFVQCEPAYRILCQHFSTNG